MVANLKFGQAQHELCKYYGIKLSYDAAYDEYQVNFINGTQETIYFTSDLEDAYATGVAMCIARQK